jgi:hypothetical protein
MHVSLSIQQELYIDKKVTTHIILRVEKFKHLDKWRRLV